MMKVTLTAIKGALHQSEFTFDKPGEYLIGRSAECAIEIPQGLATLDISRHHCLLDIDPPVIRIRDLGSRNGTYINGCKIGQRHAGQLPEEADLSSCAYCRVVHDDEIQVGHTVFRVSVSSIDESPAISPSDQSGIESALFNEVKCTGLI